MENRRTYLSRGSRNQTLRLAPAVLLALSVTVAASSIAAAAETAAQHFASPEEATEAFVAALKAQNSNRVLAIFGSEANELVGTGDAVADKKIRDRFLARYDEAHSLEKSAADEVILEVGKTKWPFPIPLVKSEQGWSFDTAAGKEEILDRRVGRNELSAIQVCKAYVDAQREYYASNPDNAPLNHYAMKFASSPGKHDGLYWPTTEGEELSPLGELVAEARAEGYTGKKDSNERRPYHGYFYKILTAQGPAASGGAYDYVVHGKDMIGGFALVAYPARYGSSGIMSFIVNHDGVVDQKDLGADTAAVAEKMKEFNPDESWKPAEDGDRP